MKLNNSNNTTVKYKIINNIKEQIYNIYYNYNKVKLIILNIIHKIVEKYTDYQWIQMLLINKH